MKTVTCPNCGNDICISDTMPTKITCEHCGDEFGVEYEPIADTPPTFGEKAQKFLRDHRNQITVAIAVCGVLYKVYSWFKDINEEIALEADSSISVDKDITPTDISSPSIDMCEEVNPDDYERKLIEHGLTIRNMDEHHYPSAAKKRQADDLGVDLGTHQTIVNSYPQHHRVKKAENE